MQTWVGTILIRGSLSGLWESSNLGKLKITYKWQLDTFVSSSYAIFLEQYLLKCFKTQKRVFKFVLIISNCRIVLFLVLLSNVLIYGRSPTSHFRYSNDGCSDEYCFLCCCNTVPRLVLILAPLYPCVSISTVCFIFRFASFSFHRLLPIWSGLPNRNVSALMFS